MDCHEALMARRRKKSGRGTSDKKKNGALLDKSLPAIPPPEARKTTYVPGTETLWSDAFPDPVPGTPSVSETLNELRAGLDSDSSRPPTSSAAAQSLAQNQGQSKKNIHYDALEKLQLTFCEHRPDPTIHYI